MSDETYPPNPSQNPYESTQGGSVPGGYLPVGVGHPGVPGTYPAGPAGKVRSTGVCILLTIVTLGIYPLYWFAVTHSEMKNHTGNGIGGPLAFLFAFFVGIVMPYLTSSEVGNMYRGRGMAAPVSGVTGLWYFPGVFILVGPLVWFIKTNGALNAYWRQVDPTQRAA